MSEMGDWINQMMLQGVFTRPPSENAVYGDPVANAGGVIAQKPMFNRPGGEVPVPAGPPPVLAQPGGNAAFQELYGMSPEGTGSGTLTGTPMPNGTQAPMSPSLQEFLRYYQSGQSALTPEMYQHFGGDALLQAVRGYDPNATWVDDMVGGGGEGGGAGTAARRLNFDITRMPQSGSGIDLLNMRNVLDGTDLRNPNYVYNDPIYGRITHGANINHKVEGLERAMPYLAALISMGAPIGAAALAAGGVGLAGAGATSMVTGGAAGLGAANIPGAAAAAAGGAAPGASGWWGRAAGNLPRTAGPALSGAPSRPLPPRPGPRSAPTGRTPPMFPDTYGFDPNAYNSAGSAARPKNNESSMVATQFADDPYGFSNRGF